MENTEVITEQVAKPEVDYQSLEARYYESLTDFDHYPYPPIIQRTLGIKVKHSEGKTEPNIELHDCITDFKWKGTLGDLIAILSK
jgi:hypothetical protein